MELTEISPRLVPEPRTATLEPVTGAERTFHHTHRYSSPVATATDATANSPLTPLRRSTPPTTPSIATPARTATDINIDQTITLLWVERRREVLVLHVSPRVGLSLGSPVDRVAPRLELGDKIHETLWIDRRIDERSR